MSGALKQRARIARVRRLQHNMAATSAAQAAGQLRSLEHSRERLAQMLTEAAEAGDIVIDDPLLAAGDIFALWSGFMHKEIEFRISPPFAGEAIDARVA